MAIQFETTCKPWLNELEREREKKQFYDIFSQELVNLYEKKEKKNKNESSTLPLVKSAKEN